MEIINIRCGPIPSHSVVLHTLVANLSEQRLSCMDSANGDIFTNIKQCAGRKAEKRERKRNKIIPGKSNSGKAEPLRYLGLRARGSRCVKITALLNYCPIGTLPTHIFL